jgi:hypothetical protein
MTLYMLSAMEASTAPMLTGHEDSSPNFGGFTHTLL